MSRKPFAGEAAAPSDIDFEKAFIDEAFDILKLSSNKNSHDYSAAEIAQAKKVVSYFSRSKPENNTANKIRFMHRLSHNFNLSINSRSTLEFARIAINSLSRGRSLKEIANIFHDLGKCGFNSSHTLPEYSTIGLSTLKIIAAKLESLDKFKKSNNLSDNKNNLAAIIATLVNLKNLGFFEDLQEKPWFKKLQEIIAKTIGLAAQAVANDQDALSDANFRALLETSIYCRDVLKIELPESFESLAQAKELENEVTISYPQRKVFEKLYAYLTQTAVDGWQVASGRGSLIDGQKSYKLGNGYSVTLEGKYGEAGGKLIKCADIAIKNAAGEIVFVIEVDGDQSHQNFINERAVRNGRTCARDKLIEATIARPLVISIAEFENYFCNDENYIKFFEELPQLKFLLEEIRSDENIGLQESFYDGSKISNDNVATKTKETAIPAEDAPIAASRASTKPRSSVKAKRDKQANPSPSKEKIVPQKPWMIKVSSIELLLKEPEIDLDDVEFIFEESLKDNSFCDLLAAPVAKVIKGGSAADVNLIEYALLKGSPELLLLILSYSTSSISSKAIKLALESFDFTLITDPERRFFIKKILVDALYESSKLSIVKKKNPKACEFFLQEDVKFVPSSELSKYIKEFSDEKYIEEAIKECKSGSRVKAEYILSKRALLEKHHDLLSAELLILACVNNDLSLLKSILRKSPRLCNNAQNSANALTIACYSGNLEMVHFLVEECSCDVNSTYNKSSKKVIHAACFGGNIEVIKYLIGKGANCNSQDDKGLTPIMCACEKADLSVIEFLIASGAKASHITKEGGNSVSFAAARFGRADILQLLLSHKVDVNRPSEGGGRISPLAIAANQGHLEVVKTLIANGADVNYADAKHGLTALCCACESQKTDVIDFLCKSGANINQKTSGGFTNLLLACSMNYLESLKSLIKNGADPSITDDDGSTSLINACLKNHSTLAEYLLDNKINITAINTPNQAGHTPLSLACKNNNIALAKILIKHGASILQTQKGFTTFNIAASYVQEGIFLEEYLDELCLEFLKYNPEYTQRSLAETLIKLDNETEDSALSADNSGSAASSHSSGNDSPNRETSPAAAASETDAQNLEAQNKDDREV